MFSYFRERPTGVVLAMLGAIIFLIAIRGEDTRSDLTTIEQDVYNIRSTSPCTDLTTTQCALKLLGALPEAQRRAIGVSSDTLRALQERNLRERNELLRRQRIQRQTIIPPRRTVTIFSDPVRPVIIRPSRTFTHTVTQPGPVPPPTTITVNPPPLAPPTVPPVPKVKIPPTKTPPIKTPPVTTPAVTGVTPTHTVPPVEVPQITLPCIGADPLVECERGNGKPTVAP